MVTAEVAFTDAASGISLANSSSFKNLMYDGCC